MVSGGVFMKEKQEAMLIEVEAHAIMFFKKGVQSMYDHVKKTNKQRRFLLKEFQHTLKNISNWTDEVKELEWVRFKNNSAKNVEKLIEGIFKIHVIILKGFKDDRAVPTGLEYIYECYLNIARCLWKDPFLLYDIGVGEQERHRKIKELERIISKCVRNTFIEMVKIDPTVDIDDDDEGEELNNDIEEDEDEASETYEDDDALNNNIEEVEEDVDDEDGEDDDGEEDANNGIHENGIHENGIHENGIHENGIHENGIEEEDEGQDSEELEDNNDIKEASNNNIDEDAVDMDNDEGSHDGDKTIKINIGNNNDIEEDEESEHENINIMKEEEARPRDTKIVQIDMPAAKAKKQMNLLQKKDIVKKNLLKATKDSFF
jgi:hypothetical protein